MVANYLLDFFKKKKIDRNFKLNFTKDIHAHLLPGVDDGPDTIKESIQLIEAFQKLGFTRLTATPHVYTQHYPNHKSDLVDVYAKLKNAIYQHGLKIEIDLAAEYYLDDHFEALVKQKEVLPIAKEYLLVETSFVAAPPNLYDYFFLMQTKGYKPILAHPERYLYLEMNDYEKLLDFGCQFQVNLLSFSGYYGKGIKKRAFTLLEKGWLHAMGSDVHNMTQLATLENLLVDDSLSKLAEQQWLNDFI